MDAKASVARFTSALERAYARPVERIEDQVDFDDKYQHLFKAEYDAALQILTTANDPELLAALMSALLDLFAKYAKNANNLHYYRSDQTFYELFARGKKVARDKRDVFREWVVDVRGGKATPLRRRYLELGKTYRSKVDALIAERRKDQSILDLLVDEYVAQHGYAPKSPDELYDFDPYRNEALKQALQGQLDAVQRAWNASRAVKDGFTSAALHVALAGYRGFLVSVAKQGILPLFQAIKYLQEPLFTRHEPMRGGGTKRIDGDRSPLTVEMYAMACLELLVVAQGKLALPRNRLRFTDEEAKYFLKPLRDPAYEYISNIEIRFETRLTDVDRAFAQSEAFLDLMLVTKSQIPDATLVPLGRTLRLQKFWEDVEILTLKLKEADDAQKARLLQDHKNLVTAQLLSEQLAIEVPIGDRDIGRGVARVGASPGFHPAFGRVTIVYIDPDNYDHFYIEYEALKPHLFRVRTGYITEKLFGSRVYGVHKATIGAIYIVQALLLMMGFMPVFIEAGFAGLIYEILVYYASVKTAEQAEKIHPYFGIVVGLATMALVPRPSFKRPVKGLTGDKDVPVLSSADAEALQGKRSFKDMLASHEAEGKLISDFNRGTGVKGGVNAVAEKLKALRQRFEAAPAAVKEQLPQGELATDTGATLRLGGAKGGKGAGVSGGGRRGTASANPNDAKVAKLEASQEYQEVEGYYRRLEPDEALEARKAVNAAKQELRNGKLTLAEAKQKVINVLNASKEAAGEYMADVVVLSNYEKVEFITIPVRKNGVPVLDRVYRVKSFGQRGMKYLVVEVKGGVATHLGAVTKKQYTYVGGRVIVREVPNQMIKQATGEWYYQKLMEIYLADPSRNVALVRDMFKAARNGDIESAIIKSGRELERPKLLADTDPRIKYNTDEVARWFQGRELPFDPGASRGTRGAPAAAPRVFP